MPVKVGDKLPEATLYENTPADTVSINELCAGKKVVIFGVPGAFTPSCSKTHLPGYVEHYDSIKEKGYELVICVSVNDPFVMAAWGEHNKTDGKIRMLADIQADFTKALGLEFDLTSKLGNVRSKRYSMVVEDNVIKSLNVEPDGAGLTCSLATELFKNI
ncbi:Peroxiredoxin-5, mitochondrial [Chamberlinius hualienensis]